MTLIASRASAGGGARCRPATLAGIRSTFAEASQRNMALGLWAAVGSGGAAFGPLVGGAFCWSISTGGRCSGSMCRSCWWLSRLTKVVPRQPARREQPLNLLQAPVLIAGDPDGRSERETGAEGQLALWLTALVALGGAAMLTWFIRKQLSAARPMVDMPVHPS